MQPSQVPSDINPLDGITPEPWEEHAITRDPAVNPDPWVVETPIAAAPVEPIPLEVPAPANAPDPVEWITRDMAQPMEPAEVVPREGAHSPEPVEWETQRQPAQSPEPLEIAPPQGSRNVDPVEWDTGRNTAAAVIPMEWVERSAEALPPLPAVNIESAAPLVNREMYRASRPMKIQETYWV